jgi:hypothetical protein
MFIVGVDDQGSPNEFGETNILMTSVRVAGWPWKLSAEVAVNTPQAIVTVVNTSGLTGVLEDLRAYHTSLKESLQEADARIVDRAHFESGFLNVVRRTYIDS